MSFRKSRKILMSLYEIILFCLAFVFLIPVILTFLNSFKSNTEIQMNIASLPSFSISIPKKMKQRHFEGSILNRLTENDKKFFSSFYDFDEGRYVRRYSSESEKIKKNGSQNRFPFARRIITSRF